MKCEIVRDLLPSYLDGLTSEVSNEAVGAHLETCEPCRILCQEMKQEPAVAALTQKEKALNPFRKLRRRTFQAVAIAVACCVMAAGIWFYLFAYGWKIASDEITISYSYDASDLLVEFTLKDSGVLHVLSDTYLKSGENRLEFRRCLPSPVHNAEEPGSYLFGRNYVAEEDGESKPVTFDEKDVLRLYFQNETKTLHWETIANELGLQ